MEQIINKLFFPALVTIIGTGFYFFLTPTAAAPALVALGFLPANMNVVFFGILALTGLALSLYRINGTDLPRWQWLHLTGLIGCFCLGFVTHIPQLLLFGIIYSGALFCATFLPASVYASGELRWR